jgi:hypothetical protein
MQVRDEIDGFFGVRAQIHQAYGLPRGRNARHCGEIGV